MLLERDSVSVKEFQKNLRLFNIDYCEKDIFGMCNTLSPNFYITADRKKYGDLTYLNYDKEKGLIERTEEFSSLLKAETYKSELLDTLNYGIKRATLTNKEKIEDYNLILYRKYTRKDVYKILDWNKFDVPLNIGGYVIIEGGSSFSHNILPYIIEYKLM